MRLTNGIASSGNTSALMTAGSMDVTAARLYPTTGAVGTLVAGASAQTVQTADYWADPDAVLRIHGTGAATRPAPESALGTLRLVAATVQQSGNVQAPMGTLQLGGLIQNGTVGSRVELLPGSVTSTSGAGLSLPYGGTVDGVDWRVGTRSLGSLTPAGISSMGVTLKANEIEVAPGALLDMSGRGELTGAALCQDAVALSTCCERRWPTPIRAMNSVRRATRCMRSCRDAPGHLPPAARKDSPHRPWASRSPCRRACPAWRQAPTR